MSKKKIAGSLIFILGFLSFSFFLSGAFPLGSMATQAVGQQYDSPVLGEVSSFSGRTGSGQAGGMPRPIFFGGTPDSVQFILERQIYLSQP